MTMITPSYLGETIEYSSLHACRSTLEDPTVFICDGRPVLALVPGDRRADPAKIAAAGGARYARVAAHHEVQSATGFDPGAVAPFPVSDATKVLVERELLRQVVVWAGAGSVHHLVGLSPLDLVRVSRAEVADLAEA